MRSQLRRERVDSRDGISEYKLRLVRSNRGAFLAWRHQDYRACGAVTPPPLQSRVKKEGYVADPPGVVRPVANESARTALDASFRAP